MKVLVAYASKHGSTAEVAERIGARFNERGIVADVHPAEEVVDIDIYDAVVIGSAVYYGSWMKEACELIREHRSWLAERPTWLFSVGPLGEHVEDAEQQPKELAEFREAIAPEDHITFFGKLDPSRLSFAERMVAKAVKAPAGDYRNWAAIEAWADAVASDLATRKVPAARG